MLGLPTGPLGLFASTHPTPVISTPQAMEYVTAVPGVVNWVPFDAGHEGGDTGHVVDGVAVVDLVDVVVVVLVVVVTNAGWTALTARYVPGLVVLVFAFVRGFRKQTSSRFQTAAPQRGLRSHSPRQPSNCQMAGSQPSVRYFPFTKLILTVLAVTLTRVPPTSLRQYRVYTLPALTVTLVPSTASGQVAAGADPYVGGTPCA